MDSFHTKLNTACTRVHEELDGFGLNEKQYQKALAEELRDHYDTVQTEYHLNCYYKTSTGRRVQVCANRVDILVDDSIILEIKRGELTERKRRSAIKQCQRYLKFLSREKCFLVVFKDSGVEVEAVSILTRKG